MIITIDGPTKSGKSTVARLVAERLAYYYYCSGLLYRACAYILTTQAGYSAKTLEDADSEDIATYCNMYRLVYHYDLNHGPRILFDNVDITEHLQKPRIAEYASMLGANEYMRKEIDIIQEHIIQNHMNVVADGRDMGSSSFPQAAYKFFLTASLEERAKRWVQDEEARGNTLSFEDASSYIMARDQRDTIRPHAPLVVPVDATTIDSTDMKIDEVVDVMVQKVHPKNA